METRAVIKRQLLDGNSGNFSRLRLGWWSKQWTAGMGFLLMTISFIMTFASHFRIRLGSKPRRGLYDPFQKGVSRELSEIKNRSNR